MKPEYLMKYPRYKYKMLLDKAEWQAPDAQKIDSCTQGRAQHDAIEGQS